MVDIFTKKKRSEVMSKIRGRDTAPEMKLKPLLRGTYLRYQPKSYGRPDFANQTKKIAVFVDGCFWHKCPKCFREPKSNRDYWIPKLERNRVHDREVSKTLIGMGWKVYRIWEHEVKYDSIAVTEKIKKQIVLSSN